MFWQYDQWQNAFLIQLFAIIIAFIVGKKNGIKNLDIFLAIALVSPVALFLVSSGVAGAIFLSDIVALVFLFQKQPKHSKNTIVKFAFILYLGWPLIATLIANIYGVFSIGDVIFENKLIVIHFFRFFLYYTLFSKLTNSTYFTKEYLIKLFKVQIVMLLFVFTAILLGYLDIVKVDAWNQLIDSLNDSSIGRGGMFLYRGGVGTLGTITIPIAYFIFSNTTGLYKILSGILIFIVFASILFSGSRQGISFAILSFILSVIYFSSVKNTFQIAIVAGLMLFVLFKNEAIVKTGDWVINRYALFLDNDVSYFEELESRNFSIEEAELNKKDLIYEIVGYGFGGKIHSTESDYYNTYSYFGIVGFIIYIIFIFKIGFQIYLNKKKAPKKLKPLLTLPLILILVMPLFGIQQWFIMSHGSNNSMNIYLLLFLFTIGFRVSKIGRDVN